MCITWVYIMTEQNLILYTIIGIFMCIFTIVQCWIIKDLYYCKKENYTWKDILKYKQSDLCTFITLTVCNIVYIIVILYMQGRIP